MTNDPSSTADPAERRRVARGSRIVIAIVLIGLALGAARTVVSRMSNSRSLDQATTESAITYVQVTKPRTADVGPTLALPGTLQGYVQSPISARSSGYLRKWPGRQGRAPGGDRDARDRPAAVASDGQPRPGGG